MFIKNKTFFENELSEIQSSLVNNSNVYQKDSIIKMNTSKNTNNEFSPVYKNRKSKKINPPSLKDLKEKEGNFFFLRKNKDGNDVRHKSINYTNQKKLFRNSIFYKNHLLPKDSSEFVNDSSKQILVNNKNLLISINNNYNKTHRYKYDENYKAVLFDNSNLINSTNNLNTYANMGNDNINPLSVLQKFIKNKLKADLSEVKEDLYYNKKIKYFDFFKSLFICCIKKDENKIYLINNFRIKLLSEEHLYRNNINVFLIQKIFQIDEAYKFDIKELYNNI